MININFDFFKEVKFLSNKIPLINAKTLKTEMFELIIDDNNKFYYSEESIHFIHYGSNMIFFLNVLNINNDGSKTYQNYYFDFDFEQINKNLKAKLMSYHLPNQNQCLINFSMCNSETALYLIWGQFKNTNEINNNIFAYDIIIKKWRIMKISNTNNVCVRLNASSCCFKVNKENFIFIFGGYCDHTSKFDIYNVVDIITFFEGSEIAKYQIIKKKFYKDDYKPLLDSQTIPLSMPYNNNGPLIFQILLFGGTFSKYLYNQNAKTISIYFVKIKRPQEEDKDTTVSFDNLSKKPEFNKKFTESLNLLFSSKSKNFLYSQMDKKLVIAPSFFTNQKKGIFLNFDLYDEKNFDDNKTIQQLASKNFEIMTHSEKNFEKRNDKFLSHKSYLYLMKFEISNQILPTALIPYRKDQDEPLYEIKKVAFLNDCFDFRESVMEVILIDEDKAELIFLAPNQKMKKSINETANNEDLSITKVGFYSNSLKNDVKKTKFNYSDYIPSGLKSTNYSLNNYIMYILINNDKDGEGRKLIYSIDLKTFDRHLKYRIELTMVFEDTSTFKSLFKRCSIISESNKIYIVGGELSDIKKFIESKNMLKEMASETYMRSNIDDHYLNANLLIDLKDTSNKTVIYFPSNLNEMSNPFTFLTAEYLFCINRNIIKNPLLELNFFNNISKEIYEALNYFNHAKANYLYGEFIKKENIKSEQWNCFLINLENMRIVLTISFSKKLKIRIAEINEYQNVPAVPFGLILLGKISKPEGAGFIYSYKDMKNVRILKQNRLIYLNFEDIENVFLKENEPFKPIKYEELLDNDNYFINEKEYLMRIKDNSITKENEVETLYIKPNFEKKSFDINFQNLKDK